MKHILGHGIFIEEMESNHFNLPNEQYMIGVLFNSNILITKDCADYVRAKFSDPSVYNIAIEGLALIIYMSQSKYDPTEISKDTMVSLVDAMLAYNDGYHVFSYGTFKSLVYDLKVNVCDKRRNPDREYF